MFKIRDRDLKWQIVEGAVVVLDAERSAYLKLGGSATTLWPLLVEGATHQDLVSVLTSSYGVDADRAGADLDTFLEQLRTNQLL